MSVCLVNNLEGGQFKLTSAGQVIGSRLGSHRCLVSSPVGHVGSSASGGWLDVSRERGLTGPCGFHPPSYLFVHMTATGF